MHTQFWKYLPRKGHCLIDSDGKVKIIGSSGTVYTDEQPRVLV